MAQRAEGSRRGPFAPPKTAARVRPPAARAFLVGVCVAGAVCAAVFHDTALWPTPMPAATVVALAALVAFTNIFGAFETVEGLAEYTSLAMPIGFAMLLVLDWRSFVFGVALGETFTFVSEAVRRTNPTIWYVRIFNVCSLTVAGAAALTLLRLLRPIAEIAGHDAWVSPGPAIALCLSALAYKILDSVLSGTLIALAAERSLGEIRVPIRGLISQLGLFLIAIPFARLWSENVWAALFALAPLGVAYRMLSLPELEYRARVDSRTGLTNAAAFDAGLERAVADAARRHRRVALLAIDIDHFKTINDSFGHLAGDAVIARFAEILADLARRDDVPARMGGEEFALLMCGADRADALALAERVRSRVEAETFRDGDAVLPIVVTTSVGVAIYPDDAASSRELYGAADGALYIAKREGRNAVRSATRSSGARLIEVAAGP